MSDKKENPKKATYEKPVSLAGASFTEVVGALLNTKPISKEEKGKDSGKSNSPR